MPDFGRRGLGGSNWSTWPQPRVHEGEAASGHSLESVSHELVDAATQQLHRWPPPSFAVFAHVGTHLLASPRSSRSWQVEKLRPQC